MNQSETNVSMALPANGERDMFVIGAVFFMSIVVVLLNSAVVILMRCNIATINSFINLQILNLSVSDILFGLSSIPVTLTYLINGASMSFNTCCTIFIIFIIPLNATLYHAFGICLHRTITFLPCRRFQNVKSSLAQDQRKIYIHIGIVWLYSSVVVIVPSLLYANLGNEKTICSLNTLFGDNYHTMLIIYNTSFLLPQIGINISYICMCKFIVDLSKQVAPSLDIHNHKDGERCQCLVHTTACASVQKSRLKSSVNRLEPTQGPSNRMSVSLSSVSNGKRVLPSMNIFRLSGTNESQRRLGGSNVGHISSSKGSEHSEYKSQSDKSQMSLQSASDYATQLSNPQAFLSNTMNSFDEQRCSTTETKRSCQRIGNVMNKSQELSRIKNKIYSLPTIGSSEESFVMVNRCVPESRIREIFCQSVPRNPNDMTPSQILKNGKTAPKRATTPGIISDMSSMANHNRKGHKEVLVTIGILLLVLNICATPLNFLFLIEIADDDFLSRRIKFLLVVSALLNSAINPLVYASRIKPIRVAIKHVACRMLR